MKKILQEPEILRICRVMSELGITKIKITGGEPLVRSRIPELIYQIKEISGIEKVTLNDKWNPSERTDEGTRRIRAGQSEHQP